MKRFSTPDHEFFLPISAEYISKICLTYEQKGKTILEKSEADMTADGFAWKITLTQEDTGKFSEGIASVQLHILLTNGKAIHTDEELLYVEDVQHAEVLK